MVVATAAAVLASRSTVQVEDTFGVADQVGYALLDTGW